MVNIIKPVERDIFLEKKEHASNLLEMESAAWESEFYKKDPKGITATNLTYGLWKMQQEGKNSLRNWALQIGMRSGKVVTKQAVDERLTSKAVALAKAILKKALTQSQSDDSKNFKKSNKKLKADKKELKEILKIFNNVYLHDSTTQKVPQKLVENFPGNRSHGKRKAVMRIQAVYNFTQEKWMDLTVGAYAENDQGNAGELIGKLKKNDLLIRDLGYFVLDAIEQLIENQYLITRWDNRTSIFDRNEKQLDLLTFLKQSDKIDCPVLIGSEKKIPMRMVAHKLPKAQADARIAEAKKTRKDSPSKAEHSKEYYELLKYEIFLTNISDEIMDSFQIAKMYGLRWYIEILFKSWKSYFNFKVMFDKDRMSYERTVVTIYLILAQFVYLTSEIYDYIRTKVEEPAKGCFISILKFMDVTNSLLSKILAIENLCELDLLIPQFSKHSIYEKREKQKNMKEKLQNFKELTY